MKTHKNSLKIIVSLSSTSQITVDIAFVETSALNASNVDTAFRKLISEIYKLAKAGKF